MVEARRVRYAYTTEEGAYQFALNGVDVTIQPGEFCAILGHNGSGKSTFARLVNGLHLPTEGEMLIDGMDTRDEEKLFEIRRTAGMVFQNPDNQLVATVVEEDVAFGPENIGVVQPDIVARVDAALAAVGMSEYRRRAPHMLSGGQKQRVAIAGVLALQPRLIVFDEATAMLDPRGRAEVLGIIHALHQKGMTILFITHNMEEVVDADRVIVLAQGLIQADGAPGQVFADRPLLNRAGLVPPFAVRMQTDLAERGMDWSKICLDTQTLSQEILARAVCTKPALAPPSPAQGEKDVSRGASLSVEGLTYEYMPGTPFACKAVDDVNLTIAPGEFVGIIGHTGSGKSTLIQMMAGLMKPTGGVVRVEGEDVNAKGMDRKKLRRTVGVVFQYPEYQLFEETVFADIAYGPKMTGVPQKEWESRVHVAMDLVGLDYDLYKDASPFELSGGQKRKAAIAGVLAMEPRILIMDEPVAGLDPKGRESFMQLVCELNKCGTTIIMISHNLDGLAEYADRVVAMGHGRVLLDGTAREVFANYEAVRAAGMELPESVRLAELLRAGGIELARTRIKYGEVLEAVAQVMGGQANG